jgi:hypothetical protein
MFNPRYQGPADTRDVFFSYKLEKLRKADIIFFFFAKASSVSFFQRFEHGFLVFVIIEDAIIGSTLRNPY